MLGLVYWSKKVYNPYERKLDPKTISCYFIGDLERSKGYQFYCPNHYNRIMKLNNDRFLENENFSKSRDKKDLESILESKEIFETSHPDDNNDAIIFTYTWSNDHQILWNSNITKTNAVSYDYFSVSASWHWLISIDLFTSHM